MRKSPVQQTSRTDTGERIMRTERVPFSLQLPSKRTKLPTILLATLIVACLVIPEGTAWAQKYPDIKVGENKKKQEYDHLFPLLGKKVAAKGIKLPLPLGIGVNYVFVNQPVAIPKIEINANDGQWLDLSDVIEWKNVESTVHSIQVRPDLWVFPFLNVYGIAGAINSSTLVQLAEPIELTTSPKQWAGSAGWGVIVAFGVENFFLSLNYNMNWAWMELVEGSTLAQTFASRIGYNFTFNNGMALSLWTGSQGQFVQTGDKGYIQLSEAIGEPGDANIPGDIQSTPWYTDGPAARRALVDMIVDYNEGGGTGGDTKIGYAIEKDLEQKWNMLLGARWTISDRWFLTAEAGLIKRWQAVVGLEFRYGMGRLRAKILEGQEKRKEANAPKGPEGLVGTKKTHGADNTEGTSEPVSHAPPTVIEEPETAKPKTEETAGAEETASDKEPETE